MNARTFREPGKVEKRTLLGKVTAGQLFRFPSITFEEAMTKPGESFHYRTAEIGPEKGGKSVPIVTADMKSFMRRDEEVEVVVHEFTLEVRPAELVDNPVPQAQDHSETV